ncbi:aldehyde dehydrogenase family protein [Rhodococcus koreensis]
MTDAAFVDTERIAVYRTVNPATGEVVAETQGVDDEQASALLSRADAAYRVWRDVPLSEKISLFGKVADLIDERAEALARQVTLEMGKLFDQSLAEAHTVAQMFRHQAANAEEWLADEVIGVEGFERVVVRREPMGVVLGIEPWNAPLFQAMRATVPNLMLGNTVLLKPSEITAGSTKMFDELFDRAGFPSDVYRTALVSIPQVSALISDSRIRAITLTGSDRAGTSVGEQAGRNIKPVVLELGGSDAYVVLDSADIGKAVATVTSCRLFINGQVCCSPKRIIVTDSVADAFIEEFASAFAQQIVGDPFDPETTVGPLSSASAADRLQEQYQDAVDKGATVLVPGGRVEGPGAYFTPAVLTDITPDMRIYHEEAFGPLAMVFRVADSDAAVELANSSPYGLGGTVFGDDHLEETHRVARQLDTGAVAINSWLGGPVEVPFGGTKRSGVGRELGRSGIDYFANVKTYAWG